MKPSLMHTLRQLWKGQTLARIRMNEAFRSYGLSGKVVDVGGGRKPDYFSYFDTAETTSVEAVDGSLSKIDFETDPLPYADASVDTVVLANVLEHIFDHRHLLSEIARILSPGGTLVGFVPFWTGYHPDPHDYFRYTGEALARLFGDAGFTDIAIHPVGGGPVLANFNTIVLSVPRFVRPILYIQYALLDALFLALRPSARNRTPLGYVFHVRKPS